MLRDVKGALKAELRPALLMLLRSLEKQHADTNPAAPASAACDMPSAWIVDLINKLEAENQGDWLREPLLLPQQGPTLRERLGRFFHALGF